MDMSKEWWIVCQSGATNTIKIQLSILVKTDMIKSTCSHHEWLPRCKQQQQPFMSYYIVENGLNTHDSVPF